MTNKQRYEREVMAHLVCIETEDYAMINAMGNPEQLESILMLGVIDAALAHFKDTAPGLATMLDSFRLSDIEAIKAAKFMHLSTPVNERGNR